MRIVVFARTAQNRSELELIRSSIVPGFSVLGDRVCVTREDYVPCDVAVILWSPRLDDTDRARAARIVRNLHGPNLLIIETPLVRGQIPWHFRVGFDHVHRGGRFSLEEHSFERAAAMGIELKPWRTGGEWIVIAGQLPGDYSLDGVNPTEWAIDVATYLQEKTRRPIAIRPHPLDRATDWQRVSNALHLSISRDNLSDDLARAGTWVALSSGSAVDAALAGVPTICLSDKNFAWDVSSHALEEIDSPWIGERHDWAARLAYSQWTGAEIQEGTCWRHVSRLIKPNRVAASVIA